MLGPGPVEVLLADVVVFVALDGVARSVDRLEEPLREVTRPAFMGAHDPLDLLVAADLDDGGLVTGGNDDRVIGRVVVHGVDVGPVSARARTEDVAEVVALVDRGQLLGAHRVACELGVDIEADGALVKRLDDRAAIRIENVVEVPFVDDASFRIDLDDDVTHRANVPAVGTLVVGARDANEIVAVLHRFECMAEVVIAFGQTAVEDLAAHDVVLGVALAVAPGEHAVVVLAEAHHDAALIDGARIKDRLGMQVPTQLALCVDDADLRIAAPFERAARRVVPHGALGLRIVIENVVDEVEAVLETLFNLDDLRVEEAALLSGRAIARRIGRTAVDAVAFSDLFGLRVRAVGGARVAHLDRVDPVGVEAENGNARVREQVDVAHLVLDLLTFGLGNDADGRVGHDVAAVADDGGERRDAVRIDDHLAEQALDLVLDLRTRGTACGKRPKGQGGGNGHREHRGNEDALRQHVGLLF